MQKYLEADKWDMRRHMWHAWAHETSVSTCDIRGHMWHAWAHETSVGTCDRRGHTRHPWAIVTGVGNAGHMWQEPRYTWQAKAHVTCADSWWHAQTHDDMRRLMMSCDNPQKILVEKEVRGGSEIETCVGKEGKVWWTEETDFAGWPKI